MECRHPEHSSDFFRGRPRQRGGWQSPASGCLPANELARVLTFCRKLVLPPSRASGFLFPVVERRLRRIKRTIPWLFRICAILAAFQVVVFLIAVGVM